MNGHDRRMPFSAQQNRQQHGGEQAVKAHAEGGKSAHFLADLKGAGGADAMRGDAMAGLDQWLQAWAPVRAR